MSFILPDRLYAVVPRGRQGPCLHGCRLDVHGAGLVAVEGRPLATVLEQAARFLRKHRLITVKAMLAGHAGPTRVGDLRSDGGFQTRDQFDLPLLGVEEMAHGA